MIRKKTTFKFDEKAVKKGVEILKKISSLCEEFKELIDKLEKEEKTKEIHLIGSLVAHIYSPIAHIGREVILGHTTINVGQAYDLWKTATKGKDPLSSLPSIFDEDN